jgi:hypothetical protein
VSRLNSTACCRGVDADVGVDRNEEFDVVGHRALKLLEQRARAADQTFVLVEAQVVALATEAVDAALGPAEHATRRAQGAASVI